MTPVPEKATVFVPPVASLVTVIVPLYVLAAAGAKVTVALAVPPAGTDPLLGLAVMQGVPLARPLQVSVAFPLLLIVRIAVALWPTDTLPKARFPERLMTRVTVV